MTAAGSAGRGFLGMNRLTQTCVRRLACWASFCFLCFRCGSSPLSWEGMTFRRSRREAWIPKAAIQRVLACVQALQAEDCF